MNKTAAITKHLLNGKTITSMEAIDKYKATRLAAIICNLRKDGMNITDQYEEYTGQDGDTTRFKRYWLVKEQDNDNDTNLKFKY